MSKHEQFIVFTLALLLIAFTLGIVFVVTYRDPAYEAVRITRQYEAGQTVIAP